jgi:alpha-D-xyloside xylohydrolase
MIRPLKAPKNGVSRGMKYDISTNGSEPVVTRNGNTLVKTYSPTADNTTSVRLAFYRVENDGTKTLLTNEYSPLKALSPRYYSYVNNSGYEFSASFSFSTTPDEQIYRTGTQGNDHLVNKKGQVIDLINFNTHVPTPVFMSSKGYGFVFNSPTQGRIEFSQLRNRYTANSTTVVDYVLVGAAEVAAQAHGSH